MKPFLNKTNLMLIALLFTGTLLRFFNLNWGAPFYFHPDERNIAYAILQLSFPNQLNPHFFAYGSFPIYLSFFSTIFFAFISRSTVSLPLTIIFLRAYSSVLSVFTILSLFYIGSKVWNRTVGILAALLATFSVGLIQFAHFGTFEIWITFLALWLFYTCFKLSQKPSVNLVIINGLLIGLLIGTKITNVVLLIIPLAVCMYAYMHTKNKNYMSEALKVARNMLTLIGSAVVVYLITNPFVLLDFPGFLGSMKYESSVATGTLPVFYTQGFLNTAPLLFQFLKVYPFVLNPVIEILFILAFCIIFFLSVKQRKSRYILLTAFYLLLFLSQGVLFVKWTRYMIPTLPFIYLIISLSFFELYQHLKAARTQIYQYTSISVLSFVLIFSFIWGIAYAYEVYFQPDTRVAAAQWAQKNISPADRTLTETYDLGIMPFNSILPKITLFNFYDMDSDFSLSSAFYPLLDSTNSIILPSQRLVKSRLSQPTTFPVSSPFYKNLFSGKLGFEEVYQTPCDVLCTIIYLGNPIFNVEETADIFDRPTVFIFKRI